jgi:hypothetical protein
MGLPEPNLGVHFARSAADLKKLVLEERNVEERETENVNGLGSVPVVPVVGVPA